MELFNANSCCIKFRLLCSTSPHMLLTECWGVPHIENLSVVIKFRRLLLPETPPISAPGKVDTWYSRPMVFNSAVPFSKICTSMQRPVTLSPVTQTRCPLLMVRSSLICASSSSAAARCSPGSKTARSIATGKPLCLPLIMTKQRMSLLRVCQPPQKL